MHARLPLELPGWITPHRLTMLAIAAASAAMAVPSVYWIDLVRGEVRDSQGNLAVVTICTLVLAWMLTGRALRSPARSVPWLLIGGPLAGALNAGLCLMLVSNQYGSSLPDRGGMFLLGITFGGVVGAPIGFVYGAAFAIATRPLRYRTVATHDRVDRIAIALGSWLLVVSAITASLSQDVPFPRLWIPSAALGAAMAALGGLHIAVRKRFEGRVRRGLVADWGIIEDRGSGDEVQAMEESPTEWFDGLLVRFEPRNLGPYRDGSSGVAVARVRLQAPPASRSARGAQSMAAILGRAAGAVGVTIGKLAIAVLAAAIGVIVLVGMGIVAAQVLLPLNPGW